MGRQSRLTKDVADKIAEYVRAGNFRTVAANALGIPDATISRWIAEGDRDESNGTESLYAYLAHAVREAEAEHEREILAVVVTQAKLDPKFALSYVGRRYAARWARHDNVTVSTPDLRPGDGESAKDKLIERLTSLVVNLKPAVANGEGAPDVEDGSPPTDPPDDP